MLVTLIYIQIYIKDKQKKEMNHYCESHRIRPFFSKFQNKQPKPGSVELSPDVMSDHASIYVDTGMWVKKMRNIGGVAKVEDEHFLVVVGSWNLSNPHWHVYFSEKMTNNPDVVFDNTHMCKLKEDKDGNVVKENGEYVLDDMTTEISFGKYYEQVKIVEDLMLNEKVHVFLIQEATKSFNTKLSAALGDNFYLLDGSVANPSFFKQHQRDSGTIVVNLKYFDVRESGVKLMKYPINGDDETKLKDQNTKKTWNSLFYLPHVKLNIKADYSLFVAGSEIKDPTLIFYSCHVPGNGSQYPVAGLNVTKNELLTHIAISHTGSGAGAFFSDEAKNYFKTEYNDLTRDPIVLFAMGDFNTEYNNMQRIFKNSPMQILEPMYFTHANTKSQCTCYDHALVYSSIPDHKSSLLPKPFDKPSQALVQCLDNAYDNRRN